MLVFDHEKQPVLDLDLATAGFLSAKLGLVFVYLFAYFCLRPHPCLSCFLLFFYIKPGDDLDWDEEFALQDFLKNELAERNCKEQCGRTDLRPEQTADKLTDRGEEEDGEEKWMVVDTAGEGEVRDSSTPLSALYVEAQPGHGAAKGEQGEWKH